ncbi:hypothetical protein [Azospirillum sp.]|uniref:hypothetical protein n=1 Tax=Azospirillum sp. TaxID=34012 RepID=UPI003D74DBE8
MGVTNPALRIIANMAVGKLFGGQDLSIIELGSQDVHCQDQSLYRGLFDAFGVAPYEEGRFNYGDSSRALFQALGFRYHCIDLDGRADTLDWDLNDAVCPDDFKGRFTLVTNHGTTEHLLGQHNAFRLMHDLTAPGGFMMHTLPCTGDVNHGFFRYSPLFFQCLAAANAYETVHFYLTDFKAIASYDNEGSFPSFSYIIAVLKKTGDSAFRMPMQIYDNGKYVLERKSSKAQ